jgi:hypothetical protein
MWRLFASLGGELTLARVALGEYRLCLMGRWCRLDRPRSGEGEGERPHLNPWVLDPRALSTPSVAFANFSSSLGLMVHNRQEGSWKGGSMGCIRVGTCGASMYIGSG